MANGCRLIDAYKLEDLVRSNSARYHHVDDVIAAIAGQPTVDAVEVVHGRWKYYHKQNIAVCTNCSFERDLDANFGSAVSCPNCGAKMAGEKEVLSSG